VINSAIIGSGIAEAKSLVLSAGPWGALQRIGVAFESASAQTAIERSQTHDYDGPTSRMSHQPFGADTKLVVSPGGGDGSRQPVSFLGFPQKRTSSCSKMALTERGTFSGEDAPRSVGFVFAESGSMDLAWNSRAESHVLRP